MNRSILAIIALAMLGAMQGCSVMPVEAWERGRLAKPHMASEPYPGQRMLRMHIYSSREAANGAGPSASGGGCGCY